MKAGDVRTWIALAAAILGAMSARSEVRLEESPSDPPTVEVINTPTGPWSPTGGGSSTVLNPDGDLFGDSAPGWSARGQAALAAWVRPSSSTVELAIGAADSWTALAPVDVSGAFRQPMVDPLDDVWTITWQQAEPGGPAIYLTWTSDLGRVAEPRFVANGVLIGTVPARSALHVLVLLPETGDLVWVEVQVTYVPTQPMPIELQPGGGLIIGSAGSAGGVSVLGSCGQCAELRIHDLVHDGQPVSAVTWWSGRATLHAIEITQEGPILPGLSLTSRSSVPHRQRLVQEALRTLVKD